MDRENPSPALSLVQISPTRASDDRERTAVAAALVAVMAGLYAGLSIFYFYEDFFKFIEPGYNQYITDRSGIATHVQGNMWTVLSPWRIAIAASTVFLLGMCSVSLLRRYRLARPLTLFTLWGVMVPQLFWYTEFVVDWHGGHGLAAVILGAPLVALIPTALLFEGRRTLSEWSPRCAAPARVLGTAVALGWLGFAATECLDHAYQMTGNASYAGALVTIGLSALGAYGLLRLRAWALPVAVCACFAFMMIPLGFEGSAYRASGGYIDSAVAATTGSCFASTMTAVIPVVILYIVAGPYLRKFGSRLIGR